MFVTGMLPLVAGNVSYYQWGSLYILFKDVKVRFRPSYVIVPVYVIVKKATAVRKTAEDGEDDKNRFYIGTESLMLPPVWWNLSFGAAHQYLTYKRFPVK